MAAMIEWGVPFIILAFRRVLIHTSAESTLKQAPQQFYQTVKVVLRHESVDSRGRGFRFPFGTGPDSQEPVLFWTSISVITDWLFI